MGVNEKNVAFALANTAAVLVALLIAFANDLAVFLALGGGWSVATEQAETSDTAKR